MDHRELKVRLVRMLRWWDRPVSKAPKVRKVLKALKVLVVRMLQ